MLHTDTTSYLDVLDTAWFWLALAIIGNAGGNVLLKIAAQNGSSFFAVYFSPAFLMGGVLFGVGLMSYMRALGYLPLAVAYLSVVGLSIVAVTLMAILVLGERPTIGNVIGVILVFLGVAILSRSGTAV